MAHPNSTSSPKARRLHELLEEKQEPFFLDEYLLEKGYSTRFLDEVPTMCWPGNEKRILQKLTSSQFRSQRRDGCMKRTLLSKLLQVKYPKKGLERDVNTERDQEFKNSERFGEKKMHKMDIKQLSPVSVFDFGSYKSSPASHSEEEKPSETSILDPKILDIFKQLLERAYTPEFEKVLKPLDQDQPKRKLPFSVCRSNQERIWDCEGQILRSEEKKETLKIQKKESESLENHIIEMDKVSKRISKEIIETPRRCDFSADIRKIAMEIEDAIFDDIVHSFM
ncbi:hypothetical protein LUZ61_001121 [Rhynchospora tenuis]|uniref:DUF4378 domain-containing protein n=1 Tax=Rhynchospora tenuis TaxID=198213 RepID=A0AAD5ZGL9_9POAL|nr:hypothetical protein LUZ61_001121 [Rhynchospora tenuis]